MLCIASVLSVMCCDNRKVRLRQTSNFQFRVLPLHFRWRGPKIKRDLLATPFQYCHFRRLQSAGTMNALPNILRGQGRVIRPRMQFTKIIESGFIVDSSDPTDQQVAAMRCWTRANEQPRSIGGQIPFGPSHLPVTRGVGVGPGPTIATRITGVNIYPDHRTSRIGKSGGLGDLEITEVGVLRRAFIRPEHEHRAAVLGAVRTMRLAGLDVK